MYVFNRAYRFGNSNSQTHSNDIYNIINGMKEEQRPKILGLLCDNGPDFNPSSSLVFYCQGQLWKDLNLDQLIICSYAPRSSRFNPIEIAWGNLSQALAQITLVSDAKKYDFKNNEEELSKLFIQAQEELQAIWSQTSYAQRLVHCSSIQPGSEEKPYYNYAEVKDFFKHGRKHSKHEEYKKEIQFLIKHCIKRPYYLHFKKCKESSCSHCSQKPIQNEFARSFLDLFDDQLPRPILFKDKYDGEHYPSLLDLKTNGALNETYRNERKNFIKKQKKGEKM